MNYELAKELEEAGFPQKLLNIFDDKCQHPSHDLAHIGNCCGLYAPTLSELIEACGAPFMLQCHSKKEWQAYHDTHTITGEEVASGDTPEEAVARLWLALNRKENVQKA